MTESTLIAAMVPIMTLVGTLGGYRLAGYNEAAKDRRAAEREATTRRNEFQRETLLQLQSQLKEIVIVAAALTIPPVTEEQIRRFNENAEAAIGLNDSIKCLSERVLDSRLREAIDALRRHCIKIDVSQPGNPHLNLDAWMEAIPTLFTHADGLLGRRLRTELAMQLPARLNRSHR